MTTKDELRLLVAAGGTGGHLFPATAVVKQLETNDKFKVVPYFVGTPDRMESRIIPEMGYQYQAMPIKGFHKLISLNTFMLPLRIMKSVSICTKIIKQFKPDAVLCTGAYLGYPAGVAAFRRDIPLILMESNVNPGKTIKALSKKAFKIITSFDETVEYFEDIDKSIVINLGNPVRKELYSLPERKNALEKFGLDENKRTVFVFGGSLGALSINKAIAGHLDEISKMDIQMLWQTGKNFAVPENIPSNVKQMDFINDMASAYSIADLVISRSGATTVSELAIVAKPSILVPLPSASNNEQELNARSYVESGAALMLKNSETEAQLLNIMKALINDVDKLKTMGEKASQFAKPDAAENISKIILDLKLSKS